MKVLLFLLCGTGFPHPSDLALRIVSSSVGIRSSSEKIVLRTYLLGGFSNTQFKSFVSSNFMATVALPLLYSLAFWWVPTVACGFLLALPLVARLFEVLDELVPLGLFPLVSTFPSVFSIRILNGIFFLFFFGVHRT